MILDDIYNVILERKRDPLPDSYVSSLISKGKDEILKKIGEESVEVIIASKAQDKREIINELADLWFHCIVLMAVEGINIDNIFKELENRSGIKKGERI